MTYRYLPNFALRALQLVLLVEGIVRGLMYVFYLPSDPVAMSELEKSAPLTVWGSFYIACGVVGLFGEALMSGTPTHYSNGDYNPRAWPSFIAHAGLMVLYVGLALAYGAALAEARLWHWAIVPYDVAMLAFMHWLFARRRKGSRHGG